MKEVTLFIDETFNQEFNRNGFIVLRNTITAEIKLIKDIYQVTLANKEKSGLYESTGANSEQENNFINEQIRIILFPFIEKIFTNFTFYGGAFLVKSKINSTELSLHQDWSFVDEKKNSALFFWMPLQKVTKENGTIFLIEKSHLFFDVFRSGAYPSNKISRHFIPKKFIKTIEIQDGDLLIYSPAIFHGSYKNITKEERVVATALLTNKDANFQYIHKKDKELAEFYEITPTSYLNDINYLSKGKIPPNALLKKTLEFNNKKICIYSLNKALFKFIKK